MVVKKSCIELSRKKAEARYVRLRQEAAAKDFANDAAMLTNVELQAHLERLVDSLADGGKGHTTFLITSFGD